MNFVVAECFKNKDFFCKNWNGKGNAVMADCLSEKADGCEFLVKPMIRKDCDWLYSTIAGSLPVEAEEK